MVQFKLTYDLNVTLEQRIGFELAASIYEALFDDDTVINFHISATDSLENDQAVGGAVPIFHEVHYGVLKQYLDRDKTSSQDTSVLGALQTGNTFDFLRDGELVTGDTVMLTRAQAKALGMEEALELDTGGTWTQDQLDDPTALDGYVVINNSYDWSYDFKREEPAAEGTLDFLTMALHELGHGAGFVSGLDGLIEQSVLHSGKEQTRGATLLDLLRHSEASTTIENPDGSVSDLNFGGSAYFSIDGGATALAEFESGDEYQASHWQRLQDALGIMDPTLGYQERTNISTLDLQAFDVIGWNVDYAALDAGIDLHALYDQAIASISADFGIGVAAVEGAIANGQDWYSLSHGSWWQEFKEQLSLRHGSWWIEHEADWAALEADLSALSHGSWWQAFDQQLLDLGHGSWWQMFNDKVMELGHGSWWQEFKDESMLQLGHGSWWQEFEADMLEASFGGVWQVFEQQMLALGHGSWWQEFEAQLTDLRHGSWWLAFKDDVLTLG
ncbi:MAG: NF038122 family metalloprotease, partial [Leptolyngbyaceae cyanobacterium]